jgi:hypothetical protein
VGVGGSSLGMLGEKEWEEEWKDKRRVRVEGSERVRKIMNGTRHVYLLKLFSACAV